ncbi:MAG TPA: 6-phosphogluconolactonase [Planctomycetaceae bacterium]|jgi:6-phosphogluconolactonase|nr:6-phosphogluconolactonase [Planctomycetaceae bacterium]
MQIELIAEQDKLAQHGAELLAQAAREAIRQRGRFVFAVSGGTAPWIMFEAFSKQNLEWDKVHLFQVDERIAPDGDPDRNLTHLRETLLDRVAMRPENVHPMPVNEPDLGSAAAKYARALKQATGGDAVLDLVHLGLGPDGHTASLVPGDPVLDVADRDVAITGPYQNRQRMTLTYPILNRATKILWLVTGANKVVPLVQMMAGDRSIPAGRIESNRAILLADPAAAAKLNLPK